MFNKRETSESETPARSGHQPQAEPTGNPPAAAAPAKGAGQPSGRAVIGPTIAIDGTLTGEEDLVVEGCLKGTVELKSNTLTIGSRGTLEAQVYAHTVLVDGTVKGDLYASERISIRASARIDGNILAPRISLEDGARFRGSIDMDPESEAFRNAFGKISAAGSPATSGAPSGVSGKTGGKASEHNRQTPAGDKPGPDPRSAPESTASSSSSKAGTPAA